MDPQTIFLPAKPRVSRKRRPVAASSAPTSVSVVSLTATVAGDGVLLFDSLVITDVTDVSQLEVFDGEAWVPCDIVLSFDANSITLQGASGVYPGRAWRVLSPMGVVWDNDPSVTMNVPASGTVL
jgi:hypothetical protein